MVKFYVITCSKTDRRWAKFSAQRAANYFRPVRCVNAKGIEDDVFCSLLRSKGALRPYVAGGKDLTKVQVAIGLSHYKTWMKFLASEDDYAVIVEDDVTLVGNFVKCVEGLIDELVDLLGHLDLLYLWHGHWLKEGKGRHREEGKRVLKTSLPCRKDGSMKTLRVNQLDCVHCGGAVAYVISRAFAKHLVATLFAKSPMGMPLDEFLGSKINRKGFTHLALEMAFGAKVKLADGLYARERASALVRTDLTRSTIDPHAPSLDRLCSGRRVSVDEGRSLMKALAKAAGWVAPNRKSPNRKSPNRRSPNRRSLQRSWATKLKGSKKNLGRTEAKVVLITGPSSVGKTTLAKTLGKSQGIEVIDSDD